MAVNNNIIEMINSCGFALEKLKNNRADLEKGLKSQIDKIFILKAEFGQFYDSEFFKFIKSTQQETSDEATKVKCLSWQILEFLLNLLQNGENLDLVIFNLFRILRLESNLLQQMNEVVDVKNSSGLLNLYRWVIIRLLTCDHVDAELMALVARHYIYNESECSFYTSCIIVEFLKVEPGLNAARMERVLALLLNLPIPEPRGTTTRNKAKSQVSSNEKDSKPHNNQLAATAYDSDDDSSIGTFDESEEERSNEDANLSRPIYGYRKIYVKAWLSVLLGNANNIPLNCMGSVLQHLANGLLDAILNPMILADWISGHLDGEFAVLALSCIFQLITKHGLGQESCGETCSFYAKLYECTNEDTLDGPYQSILLGLLHESLQSFMLPVQFVKKFVKQLVRCACLVSSPSAAALLAIALNLLKAHHETCLDLVHKSGDDTVDTFQHPHSLTTNNVTSESLDTFLWEIPLLLQHHSEAVSRLAAMFYSNFKAKIPFRISSRDFIGCDFDLYLGQHLDKAKRNFHQKSPFRSNPQKFTKQMAALYTD